MKGRRQGRSNPSRAKIMTTALSGVARGREGRTAPGGNQEGAAKTGVK